MNKRVFLTLNLAIGLALCGCANRQQMRSLAGQLGSYATLHQAASDDFRRRYDLYNAQLDQRVAQRQQQTDLIIRYTNVQRTAWSLGGDAARSDQFGAISAVPPDLIIAYMNAPVANESMLDAGNFDKQIDSAIKGAASMSQKPGPLEQAKSLASFASTIQTTLDDLKKKAADETAKANPDVKSANKKVPPAPKNAK